MGTTLYPGRARHAGVSCSRVERQQLPRDERLAPPMLVEPHGRRLHLRSRRVTPPSHAASDRHGVVGDGNRPALSDKTPANRVL
jgi:hypothetical protein